MNTPALWLETAENIKLCITADCRAGCRSVSVQNYFENLSLEIWNKARQNVIWCEPDESNDNKNIHWKLHRVPSHMKRLATSLIMLETLLDWIVGSRLCYSQVVVILRVLLHCFCVDSTRGRSRVRVHPISDSHPANESLVTNKLRAHSIKCK